MSQRKTTGHGKPAIRAAFTRQMPERGPEHQKPRKPMTDEQLQAWSQEQAEKHGIHRQAREAAKLGKTVMVFVQACNESIPYEEYLSMLESGFHPSGHPDPEKSTADAIYKTTAKYTREEQREAEVAEAVRMEAMELYGLDGPGLDEFIAGNSEPKAA
jgi:hypothetical protein